MASVIIAGLALRVITKRVDDLRAEEEARRQPAPREEPPAYLFTVDESEYFRWDDERRQREMFPNLEDG